MSTATKVFLGVAGIALISYWCLTTKNEVVESVVYPLKVKLGLAKYQK